MSQKESVERRIQEVKENKSTDLYLRHCDLIQIPDEVFKLKHLQHLDLRNNRLVYLPGEIARLKNLQGLYLNNNRLKELPDEITGLKKLQVLKVDENRLKRLPENISQLKKLRYLYFRDNHLRTLPAELFRLEQLKVLYLSNNRLEALPEDISRLNLLEVLDLAENRLPRLPKEISRLVSLQLLYLSRNRLTELPPEMFQLTQLIRLDLNFNRLREMPEDISMLENLRVLSLEGNRLDRLTPEIFHLENLSVLNLDGNRINWLPERIFHLKRLEYLSLSRNQLKQLPQEISQLKNLVYSGIDKNPLEIPPIEIAGRGIDAIRHYFNQRGEQGEDYLVEADLILLGEPGVGKTTLAKKLLDPAYHPAPSEPRTKGIAVKSWHFPYSPTVKFNANILDFGGEETIRPAHGHFINKRSLCIVVLDNREDDSNFYYWYDLIGFLIAREQPVMIVLNEKYGHKKHVPTAVEESFERTPDIFIVDLSDNSGLTELTGAIRKQLKELPHVGKEPIPKKWVDIRLALSALSRDYISRAQYFEICSENGVHGKADALRISEFLHDLGLIFHFQKDNVLKKNLILNTGWVSKAIYRVLADETLNQSGGRVDIDQLKRIWNSPAYREMQHQLLRVMVNLELCYGSEESGKYFIPQLLSPTSPGVTQFQNTPITERLHFRYRYFFMPEGILSRLMVRMNRYIYGKMFWRNGVVLQIGDAVAEIVENPYRKDLQIRISGEGRTEALALLREEIKDIHDTLQYLEVEELIPCHCSQCSNQRNPRFYSYRILKEYRRKGRYKIVCQKSLEDVVIHGLIGELTPPPSQEPPLYDRIVRTIDKQTEILKKRNKLFIAYSRSDVQWLERVRTYLKEFEDEGFELDIWDDSQLDAGKKWEQVIEDAIAEIKVAVLLISTDFLASAFIVQNELPPLLEAAERDGTVILPLILKPSRFTKNPHLAQFQPVNDPDKPLITLPEGGQEEMMLRLTETIDDNLRDINPSLTR
ncbi:MAG: TIR domain-containing protein [bacterium]|nr:TIR domain-containing protein [bacterium]